MAGLTKTQIQLGDSATATHNFVLSSAAAVSGGGCYFNNAAGQLRFESARI